VVGTDIEQQQALPILREQAVIDRVIGDGNDAGAFATRGVDRGDWLLARIEAGRTDREIGDPPGRKAVRTELVNRYAVRTALADEETSVSAIQRSNVVSILT
jgi:hypothetical protein